MNKLEDLKKKIDSLCPFITPGGDCPGNMGYKCGGRDVMRPPGDCPKSTSDIG